MSVLMVSLQRSLDVLGMQFVHNYLLQNGHKSTALFLPHFQEQDAEMLDTILAFARDLSPKLIGFSLTSMEYLGVRALTQFFKEHFPEVPIVWGGSHPMAAVKPSLAFADYVCVGEGELSMLDMANAVERGEPLDDIPNLAYLKNGEFHQNELYPLVEDLDTLPTLKHVPDNSYLFMQGKIVPLDWRMMTRHLRFGSMNYNIITTRGCPFHCTYCCNNILRELYPKRRVRRRSVEHVMRELVEAFETYPKLQTVNFQDDCFLASDLDYLREFCEEYKRRIHRPMIIRSIPTYVTKEKLDLLYDAGLSWFSLGLQSGSARTCKDVYHRYSSPQAFLDAVEIVQQYYMAFWYDVILDNPYETIEDCYEGIDVITRIPGPAYPQMLSLALFYNTELYRRAVKEMPERRELFELRDFTVYYPRPINVLFEIATMLPSGLTRKLVRLFQRNPEGVTTRLTLAATRAFCRFVLMPITYFRLIQRAQRGSFLKTLIILPSYVRLGLERYLNTFKTPRTEFNILDELKERE